MNRRQLLASLAAGSLSLQAKKLKKIGCQLYTLRSVIDAQPKAIFDQLDGAGYDEVEAVRGNLDKIWDALKASKLKPVSLHIDTRLFTVEQDKLGAALDDAKAKGFKYVVCPYIAGRPRRRRNDQETGRYVEQGRRQVQSGGNGALLPQPCF